MNLWCSVKVTKGLEKPGEEAVGNRVGAAPGWPLGGCLEAGGYLNAWGFAGLQAMVCWPRAGECFPLPALPDLSLVN